MKEKPILFKGEMVRAVLDGHKTQTRRVMKPQVEPWGEGWQWNGHAPNSPYGAYASTYKNPLSLNIFVGSSNPYGKKGDGLWVRETWGVGTRPCPVNGWRDGIEYKADEAFLLDDIEDLPLHEVDVPEGICLDDYSNGKWKPSIHMFRWASRINLEITDIRVERVQDISVADCRAEGSPEVSGLPIYHDYGEESHRIWFEYLWDSINCKSRKDGIDISWKANPWVWVVCFKVVK